MSDEWVPVSDEYPSVVNPYKHLSREVYVMLENGERCTAFLDYNKMQWRNADDLKVLRRVTAWKDI